MSLLPEVDFLRFKAIHRRPLPFWRPALEEIRRRQGLPAGAWRRAPAGRNVVFALARVLVVKLVPPIWRDQAEREAVALELVAGRLPVRTPELVATGALDGWRYLVFTFLEGRTLGWNWSQLPPAERRTLARQSGRLAAAMHALPVPDGAAATLRFDWPALLEEQLSEAADDFAGGGLASTLIASFPAYLRDAGDLAAPPYVLLHGDLSAVNLVVEGAGDTATITGLVDFGDTRLGPFDHEFISPVMHFFQGEAAVLEAFYRGYGLTDDARGEALERRLMARSALYYAELIDRYRRRLPGPFAERWPELARCFWRMTGTTRRG